MRKVKIKHKPEGKDRSKNFDMDGMFHKWAADFSEFEAGPGNYTIGLVELSDGRVVKVDPTHIQFVDKA